MRTDIGDGQRSITDSETVIQTIFVVVVVVFFLCGYYMKEPTTKYKKTN